MDSSTITLETPSRSTFVRPTVIWSPCMILYPERSVGYSTQCAGTDGFPNDKLLDITHTK
jgi:hypothetical protein